MDTVISGLPKWFSERPKWLQIAATRLIEQIELSDKDISDFASFCQQEAEGKLTQVNCSFSASAFSQSAAGNLRLCSISDIEGVNALAPKKPLKFGKGNITVIYGYNGSGKSGYVRLLKHICGARGLGTLHRNVYKSPSIAQKASISFEQNGTIKSYMWTDQGICDDLKSVDIFDTSTGRIFVSSEEEVSYEPPILSFFSLLIEVCEKVAAALDSEVNRQQSKKPNMSVELRTTGEGIWYENISAQTTSEDIDRQCFFGTKDGIEIQSLQLRLAEQAPSEKAKQLRKQKSYIDALVQDAQKYLRQLSDKNCRRIIAAQRKSILKKIVAETAADKVFSDSPSKALVLMYGKNSGKQPENTRFP